MLRDYQLELKKRIRDAHAEGAPNVLAVMPTGAGKTVTMASIADEFDGPVIAIAHRQELVSQISMAFASQGVEHRIIAPHASMQAIMAQHVSELGRNWVRHNAHTAVAGVDSLIRRDVDNFLRSVRLWQTDEAHHLREENKWGRAAAMFPEAIGIGWTATPVRTDRKSLKRGQGGVFDKLVVGPSMRELIGRSFLSPYQIYGLPQAINLSRVKIGSNGEFVQSSLSEEAHASRITGDIVQHYLRIAPGKSAVTFAVDVAMAEEHAAAFRAAGVSTGVLHAKTPASQRIDMIKHFKARTLQMIVNVDVLGEGFDCPGIEVIIMARPTMSYGLFVQQFGRCLRILAGKAFGIILDHVGNVARHGVPDAPRAWSLDVSARKQKEATVKITICGNWECMRAYEGYEPCCPYCGFEPVRMGKERERPEIVEGDLTLYTPEMITALQAEVGRIMGGVQIPRGLPEGARFALERRWNDRQEAQAELADAIDAWAGRYHNGLGESIRAVYRRFYASFGMDTLAALAQTGNAMREMREKLENEN